MGVLEMVETSLGERKQIVFGLTRRGAACLTAWVAILAAVALACAFSGSAIAAPSIHTVLVEPTSTQAGGHPDVVVKTSFGNSLEEIKELPPSDCFCEDPRVITFHYPAGFIGDPHAVPQCTLAEFAVVHCPPSSQVGILDIDETFGFVPIYNVVPRTGEPGLIAFLQPYINAPLFNTVSARTGSDFGLDVKSAPILHLVPVGGIKIYLWGVPADASHDALRFPRGLSLCLQHGYPDPCSGPVPSSVPPDPFLQNPTSCGLPLSLGVDIAYYEGTEVHADAPWPSTTGCDQLSFNPSLAALPTTTQADTSSGLDIELNVPQPQSATVPSPSAILASRVTLPVGFSLGPNGADGKAACNDEEAKIGTEDEGRCPEFAKVGTSRIDSSALPGPIDGAIYIGDPLSGEQFRIIITADGFATHIKIRGSVSLDPNTGQIVTRFDNLPQSPLQKFNLHFFGSERGIFATPPLCGVYPIEAEFTPWDSALPNQISRSSFRIDSGPNGTPCPGATRPFGPSFAAGTADNTAGVSSPMTLRFGRNDGEQGLAGFSVELPRGLIQSLHGVTECPQASIDRLTSSDYSGLVETAAPLCPASSQLGSLIAGTGAGTHPLFNTGRIFLAGPYKGAPLSLVVVIPAVAGPYDLGNIAVRAAVFVDPRTAQVSAVADPLPQLIDGVPLRIRSVQLKFDRAGLNMTPTNCAPHSFQARLAGDQGGHASPAAAYQVANCDDLGFGPQLAIRASGGIGRRGHPALHATLSARPGDANLDRSVVTLPAGEIIDNAHLQAPCTRVQFAANACPRTSVLGSASVQTPLLDTPLEGPIYLRSSSHPLPDLVLDLHGRVDFELAATIDSRGGGGLRTKFEGIPDVPVSRVQLDLLGGSKGLLINTENICSRTRRVKVKFVGQNGKAIRQRPKLEAGCGNGKTKGARRRGDRK